MKQTIAVDIDDVLAAEAEFVIEFSNKRWGHSLSLDDYHEHWEEMWGVDMAEMERRSSELHGRGIVSSYRLLDEAHATLERLAKKYRLVVLSSRRAAVQDETLEWLEKNFAGIFDEVRFTGFYDTLRHDRHLMTKADILQDMHAQYLIDDQPKHCFAAAAAGMEVVLFGDYGVSRHLHLPEGVTRCKDWLAVREYFDGKA